MRVITARSYSQIEHVISAATQAPSQSRTQPSPRICVIGGGVIGITTAVRIKEYLPQCHLTLVADKLVTDTTSVGAAGLWKPFALSKEQDPLLINKWGKDTFDHYMRIFQSPDAGPAGILLAPAYELFGHPVADPDWASIVPGFHHLTAEELDTYDPTGTAVDGFAYQTFIAEGALYLKWLLEKLKSIDGTTVTLGHVAAFSDLAGDFDVVANCTGLHARELTGDETLHGIRGHVLRVKAPWVRHHVEGLAEDEDHFPAYIIPNSDTVVLGGTKQVGNEDTRPRDEERRGILERCRRAIPSLEKAEVVGEWVGLRPGRPGVRLELELVKVENRSEPLPVLHNYGHGGSGLTLAWGCAGDAADMIARHVRDRLAVRSHL